MFLAVDIGNTNINLGVFSGHKGRCSRLVGKYAVPTRDYSVFKSPFFKKKAENREGYATSIRRIFKGNRIDQAAICSVVPDATKEIEQILLRLLGKRPIVVGRDIKVPMKNLYRPPGQAGQDRLVNAYYASVVYGGPSAVIDFGTAVTFDAVSKKKEYLGGMILPGLNMSLTALAEKTALLPNIKLNLPKGFIARDTKNSMLSGVVHGFSGMCDYLIDGLKERIGKEAKIIGTGGDIRLMRRYCRKIDTVDQDLTLKAIYLLSRAPSFKF